MPVWGYIEIIKALLLLLIAALLPFIIVQLRRSRAEARASALYDRRLAVFRETVRILTLVSQTGDISREELAAFRSRTQESIFLFGKETADYLDEIYSRGLKLRATNEILKGTDLPVGDERDRMTIENSQHLIWLADQLPLIKHRFEAYLVLSGLNG